MWQRAAGDSRRASACRAAKRLRPRWTPALFVERGTVWPLAVAPANVSRLRSAVAFASGRAGQRRSLAGRDGEKSFEIES